MGLQQIESVLKNLRQHVCDCVTAIPISQNVQQIVVGCLKSGFTAIELKWDAEASRMYLSDNGALRRRRVLQTNPDGSCDLKGRFDPEARRFGVEVTPTECLVPVTASTAGDGFSRLMQFLSRCEVLLESMTESTVNLSARERVRQLLIAAAGEQAASLVADDLHAPPLNDRPIVVRTNPPWEVYVIETDRDANTVIRQLESGMAIEPHRLAIFQNQLRIRRQLVARIADLVDRQFSNVQDSAMILAYLRRVVFAPSAG